MDDFFRQYSNLTTHNDGQKLLRIYCTDSNASFVSVDQFCKIYSIFSKAMIIAEPIYLLHLYYEHCNQ